MRLNDAGASSLNLMVLVDVNGRCADQYFQLQQEIQTALVRICNENGLVIPFIQLMLNLPKDLKKAATKDVAQSTNQLNYYISINGADLNLLFTGNKKRI